MTTVKDARVAEIRRVVGLFGRLSMGIDAVADSDDLYACGMTSHASVSVMLALEDAFDLEFPDEMLTREVFASVSSMATALSSLLDGPMP